MVRGPLGIIDIDPSEVRVFSRPFNFFEIAVDVAAFVVGTAAQRAFRAGVTDIISFVRR